MAYTAKKYARINWKNRPSTATALGATNLNHMDVFLNEIDNAMIEFEAAKLNIATANSMIASLTIDTDSGVITAKQLDGTTFTWDLNLEKIPVSFSLAENGVLTMVTDDGTEYTANISELIKDYVFDDSETIAFTKEFVTSETDTKGTYHVTAIVKAGSIKAEHLDPDYRADIQQYSNTAQVAANDSLTYSKDSKRWAVGDAEYEGSTTDNSKYYKEQAEAAKVAAETARDEAQAATGAVIATTERVGVVKPDGITMMIDPDGTLHGAQKFESTGYVYVESAAEEIEPVPEPTLNADKLGGQLPGYYTDATNILAQDIQGLAGVAGENSTVQALINAIADKVANQLVTNTALTTQLADYVTKAMMSGVQVNDANHVPTSALAYTMQQAIDKLNSEVGKRAMRTYNSVTQLGLSADVTPEDLVEAMPTYSEFYNSAANMTAPEWNFPGGGSMHFLHIIKTAATRSALFLRGKRGEDGDYRMFLGGIPNGTNNNAPTQEWEKIQYSYGAIWVNEYTFTATHTSGGQYLVTITGSRYAMYLAHTVGNNIQYQTIYENKPPTVSVDGLSITFTGTGMIVNVLELY